MRKFNSGEVRLYIEMLGNEDGQVSQWTRTHFHTVHLVGILTEGDNARCTLYAAC